MNFLQKSNENRQDKEAKPEENYNGVKYDKKTSQEWRKFLYENWLNIDHLRN